VLNLEADHYFIFSLRINDLFTSRVTPKKNTHSKTKQQQQKILIKLIVLFRTINFIML
jgi:hypothetical protein